MNDPDFKRLIDRYILECRWSDISARWLKYLPDIDPPGSAPDISLSEVVSFGPVVSKIPDYGTAVRAEAAGVRQYVFREAVYLLHKAFHVTGCAENQAKQGYKTWSLAEAYQASLFAAKAILHFCGIASAEFNNKAVLVDVFPKWVDIHRRRKEKLRLPDDPAIQFIKLNMQFQHRHIWVIFQRLLSVVVFDESVLPDSYIQALIKLGSKDFAKQRNDLNYKNGVWLFDDLHDLVVDRSFGEHPPDIEKALVEPKGDFSLSLSLAILRMGVLLLESITELSNAIKPELQMIRDRVTTDRHPLYSVAYP